MVVYAPPNTAVYYALHKGWTPELYKLTDLVDGIKWLVWSKSKAGQDNPNEPPDLEWRPGDPIPNQEPAMTIGEYMRLSGYFDEGMEGANDD